MKFKYQAPLVIFFFIAMFTLTAAAPVGKVFQVKGNTVEITGPGVARLKVGNLLQITTGSGTVDVRVKQTFHSKVTASVVKGNAGSLSKGDAVHLKGKEKEEPPKAEKTAPEPIPEMKALLTHTEYFNPGWDIISVYARRASMSFVVLGIPSAQVGEAGIPQKVRFEVELVGAEKDHEYTAGMHLFNAADLNAPPEDTALGYQVGQISSSVTREGTTAICSARDFGTVKTDAEGNGKAIFEYDFPAGQFHFQFTIRNGQCRPDKQIFTGCNTVFRSGQTFAKQLIHFKYP